MENEQLTKAELKTKVLIMMMLLDEDNGVDDLSDDQVFKRVEDFIHRNGTYGPDDELYLIETENIPETPYDYGIPSKMEAEESIIGDADIIAANKYGKMSVRAMTNLEVKNLYKELYEK